MTKYCWRQHLPGNKVKSKIAEVRNLAEGDAAISPARFPDRDREMAHLTGIAYGGVSLD